MREEEHMCTQSHYCFFLKYVYFQTEEQFMYSHSGELPYSVQLLLDNEICNH
jgi:hypothetical protein